MVWTQTKTWGPELWTVSDANAQVGGNIANIRNYQRGSLGFVHAAQTVLDSGTPSVFNHLSLCPTPPAEKTRLTVFAWAQYVSTNSGSPTSIKLTIYEKTGTSDIGLYGAGSEAGLNLTDLECWVGAVDYTSGDDPGFVVKAFTSASASIVMDFVFLAFVNPRAA